MVTETHQQTIFQLGGRRREPQPRPGFMTSTSPSSTGDATTSTSARDFLTAPRKMVRVGTWNVRTMYQASVAAQTARAEKRRWRYMGHVLRRPAEITNVSLGWAPEGTRRKGRPRETWRRTTLRKMASAGLRSWGEAAAAAKNRTNWKKLGESVVETLCGTRHSAK